MDSLLQPSKPLSEPVNTCLAGEILLLATLRKEYALSLSEMKRGLTISGFQCSRAWLSLILNQKIPLKDRMRIKIAKALPRFADILQKGDL